MARQSSSESGNYTIAVFLKQVSKMLTLQNFDEMSKYIQQLKTPVAIAGDLNITLGSMPIDYCLISSGIKVLNMRTGRTVN